MNSSIDYITFAVKTNTNVVLLILLKPYEREGLYVTLQGNFKKRLTKGIIKKLIFRFFRKHSDSVLGVFSSIYSVEIKEIHHKLFDESAKGRKDILREIFNREGNKILWYYEF